MVKNCVLLALFCLFCVKESSSQTDIPVVCGGFIKSQFRADFTRVKVNLYSLDGSLKYSTDCAPNNGYFLLPLYDQGEYLVKAVPPCGWMITPNEVPLVVKDSKDPCNSGNDIFFQLVGFTLEGQVTSGDGLPGPEGVEISVSPEESDTHVPHVYTTMEGRFKVEGVSPGTYQLSASHPLWKISQDSVQAVVVDAPVTAPVGLKVLGYDVKGAVKSGGEPVKGVLLYLFALLPEGNKEQIACSLSVASPPASPKPAETPLCTVSSDSAGHFILYPVPPGSYSVVPVYRQGALQFEVHPVEVQFTVSNDSVILSQHFEVQGFSVTGQVLFTPGGVPVFGAAVTLDDGHHTTSDEHGHYQLLNVTTGTYTLKVDAPDMQFDPREVYISPTSPSLPSISPNKYAVCGDVTEPVPVFSSRKSRVRSIQVLSNGSNPQVVTTFTTSEKGNFCVHLPLGEYRIKVIVPTEETERGMLILPEEQFVAMLDAPVTSRIVFTQFVANLSGSVTCIENCPATFDIQLTRSREGLQVLSAQVKVDGKKAQFNFTNVLPGAVKVKLNCPGWCWELPELATVVVKGSQSPLHFIHTGYSMSYEVSHNTSIRHYQGNGSTEETVLVGKGVMCLKETGVHHIIPQSCHEFEKESYTFNTSLPMDLVLLSTGHSLLVPVHTETEDASLSLVVRSPEGERSLLPDKVEMVAEGKSLYSFVTLVRTSEELIIQPRSSVLMFSPPSLVWIAGQECPETATQFFGSPGELIEGRVEPSLPNVRVVLDLGSDGQITTYTDEEGYYRAGPVRGGNQQIHISVVLDGYIFEPALDDLRSFRAIKLCDVTVQVHSISGGEPLVAVLVSISGENFRRNSFTDEIGVISYSQLVPGQYFIKPFLREFEFTPLSLILNLTEGKATATVFTGRRVAFSCSGVASTLNRRPFVGVSVQASGKGEGEECSSYSETTTTDSEGAYRLHGLMPGCEYNVSINDVAQALPTFRTLVIEDSDIEKVDFLLVSQNKLVYISGWIDTDPKFVGTLKAGVYIEGKTEETPLYSVTVDTVGFFDFPPLSLLSKGNYLITLQSSLSSHSYKYTNVEQVVSGSHDSHLFLQFTAEELHMEKESQSRGSVVALFLVIGLAFAAVNFEKVLAWLRSYVPLDGSESRRKSLQKNHKK